jgi:tetratricopeptide (TPR) repeat protein
VVAEEATVQGSDPAALRAYADAVLEQHEVGDLEGALESCERLLAATAEGDLEDAVVRETLFTARFERALLLTELGELEVAAEAYAQAAATPADMDDPDQRHERAMAQLNHGICLVAADDHEAALRVYDELIATFRDAADPVTRDQVVRARVNRSAALLALGDPSAARAAAEELIEELDERDALDAEQLAMAIRLRAASLPGRGPRRRGRGGVGRRGGAGGRGRRRAGPGGGRQSGTCGAARRARPVRAGGRRRQRGRRPVQRRPRSRR